MENDVSYKAIQPYLTDGEYVLWRGKPDRGNLLSKSDVYMIPFSVVWCSIAAGAAFSSLRHDIGSESLFFIPFLLVGLYITVGRFFHTAWLRKRTCYAITNLKVIRICNNKVNMLMGSNLPPVTVETFKNGNGTIYIGQPTQNRRRGFAISGSTAQNAIALENIPDVVRVQRYLTQISTQ